MKNNTNPPGKGWSGLPLQSRLFLVFTILFGFSVLVLSLLLNNVIQMMRIQQQTREAFETNRQAYRLQSTLQQFQVALQTYENSASPLAEENLAMLQDQVLREHSVLYGMTDADAQPELDRFASQYEGLKDLSSQIIAKVDEEAWDDVLALHTQAGAVVQDMQAIAAQIQEAGMEDLQAAQSKAEVFQWTIWIFGLAALPLFLLLAVLTAVVIDRQMNRLLDQLAGAARALESGAFQPQPLESLAARSDEIGALARRFLQMAAAVEQRTALLQQEADAIQAKIR